MKGWNWFWKVLWGVATMKIVIFLKWVTEFTVKCFSKFVISSCHRTWFIKRLLMKLPVLHKQSWFGVISSVIKSQLFTGERGNYSLGGTEEIRSWPIFNMPGSCTFNKLIHLILFFISYLSELMCQVVYACGINERDNLVIVTLKYMLPMQYVLN